MREIRFRAWDNLEKKFLWPWPEGFNIFGEVTCFNLIEQQLKSHNKSSLERMNDIEIMQYTGLRDKNSKGIYEGDIVKANWSYANTAIITWDNQRCGFYCKPIDGLQKAAYDKGYKLNSAKLEIIGNIYENPELLNETPEENRI